MDEECGKLHEWVKRNIEHARDSLKNDSDSLPFLLRRCRSYLNKCQKQCELNDRDMLEILRFFCEHYLFIILKKQISRKIPIYENIPSRKQKKPIGYVKQEGV